MTSPTQIPAAAWSRRFDAAPIPAARPSRPSLRGIVGLLPTIVRLWRQRRRLRSTGRMPVMDPFEPLAPDSVMGVPLGGLGGGSITRGWLGDFVRWQMQPGITHYRSVPADQFSVCVMRADGSRQAQVLYPGRPRGSELRGWRWGLPAASGTYYALFPRAWTVYEEPVSGVRLTCRQVSPVLPHNYRESSMPVGVFAWTVENTGNVPATISLMFTFQNGTGGENDRAGGHFNEPFVLDGADGSVVGVALHHIHRQPRPAPRGRKAAPGDVYEDPLTFAIAAQSRDDVEVSTRTRFATNGDGAALWADFAADGRLDNSVDVRPSVPGETIGGAVCAAVSVPPGEAREVVFALAWDMPRARFGEGRAWFRRYTRFYGRDGNAAPLIARDALADYPTWEVQIEDWQSPVLEDRRLPDWYKQALFNEAYFLVDGGTIWTDGEDAPDAGQDNGEFGHFAYLEGHEYLMYNTYDVHFYASFALAQLWPELELSLQRDFARALLCEDDEMIPLMFSRERVPRKVWGIIPHDLGGPTEDPWYRVNIYDYQDVSRWKDLNSKFVLQVYRDFIATQDVDFLAEMWEPVTVALETMQRFDRDGDGLIENDGFPDQTFDTWTVKGPSAYCGGLWLAALQAASQIASILDHPGEAHAYRRQFQRAREAYSEALWNGEYFNYDASGSAHHDSVMADQLAGDWYARACGLPGIVPERYARSALRKVFDLNVMGFLDGEAGAVNGMRPDGKPDVSSMQAQEVWPGVTYGLAAAMLHLGMDAEAWRTAWGAVKQTYEVRGYWFMTPEAWTADGGHRSLAYMRPLAIWAMKWAWDRRE
ncbi:MAG: non-lysosomal glucosylceramidase [Aggregatilineales bacterium]